MVKASIDIGSNSTLLLIMEDSSKKIIQEESTITALGKNLDATKKFQDESMFNTYFTLKKYVDICESYKIKASDIIATATEASRVASNAKAFYENVEKTLGLKVQTISGEAEAYYTAFGVTSMLDGIAERAMILDVGGASSEVILINTKNFQIEDSISLPVGSVRSTDWLAEGSFEDKINKLMASLHKFQNLNIPIICVAGTLTSLSLLMQKQTSYSDTKVNSHQVTLDEFCLFCDELQASDISNFSHFDYLGKRARSIVGGALCSKIILKELNVTKIYFSSYGLRYGTLLSGGIDERYRV